MNDHGNDPGHNVPNQQPTELSELITRAQIYMRTRFGHFLNDEEMFSMWNLTLNRIDELSAFGDPAFSVERFVAETIPGMLVRHWMEKYADTILMPARRFMKSSGIPWDSDDQKEVENSVWGIMVPQWFRDGKVACLGRNIRVAALVGVRIEDLKECSCSPICKCSKAAPISFQRALYELVKHAAGSWRTKHRHRDQSAANAAAKAKREAAKLGIVYVAPPRVDPSEVVWAVSKPSNMGNLDAYTGVDPSDVNGLGIPTRHKHAGDDASIVTIKPIIRRQRAAPSAGNASDAGAIQQQRWAEGCSTHKTYHFTDDEEGRAALEAWVFNAKDDQGNRPHKVTQSHVHLESDPQVIFAPRQLTGDEPIITTWGNEKRYLYHKTFGKVEFVNHCSDGMTWVAVDKQRLQVVTADLADKKLPKPKRQTEKEILAFT